MWSRANVMAPALLPSLAFLQTSNCDKSACQERHRILLLITLVPDPASTLAGAMENQSKGLMLEDVLR